MEQTDVEIIDRNKFTLFISLYVIIGTALTTWLALYWHAYAIIWIGLFIFLVCPGLFSRSFRRRFLSNARFSFSENELRVEIADSQIDEVVRTDKIQYSDIEGFRAISSSKDDTFFLRVKLKNGSSFVYSLVGQNRSTTDKLVEDLVFDSFNRFNDAQTNPGDKIKLMPSLFATKTGTRLIMGLSILVIIAIVLQIVYLPKSIPATLFLGLSFYIIILAQRKKDLQQVKRLHQ